MDTSQSIIGHDINQKNPSKYIYKSSIDYIDFHHLDEYAFPSATEQVHTTHLFHCSSTCNSFANYITLLSQRKSAIWFKLKTYTHQLWSNWMDKSMGQCKKDVTPVHQQCARKT